VAAVCMAFRGVKLVADGGPFDVAATTATGIDTFTPNPPSISGFDEATSWVVAVGAAGHVVGAGSTLTAPTGYTTNAIDSFQEDTSNTTVAMGYKSSPSDPEDPGTFTHNGTDNAGYSWAAVTMALRVSASGAPHTSIAIIGI
jgi:hypothetical protein